MQMHNCVVLSFIQKPPTRSEIMQMQIPFIDIKYVLAFHVGVACYSLIEMQRISHPNQTNKNKQKN